MTRYLRYALLMTSALLLVACTTTSKPDLSREQLEHASDLNAELGVRYMQQGDNERAMGKLQKAIEQNSKNARAHHYLGELYRRVERPKEAEKHFRQALRYKPDDPSLLNNYAVLLCDLEKFDESERYFAKALEDPVYSDKAGNILINHDPVPIRTINQGEIHAAEKTAPFALPSHCRMH